MILMIDNYDSFTYNLVQYAAPRRAPRSRCCATMPMTSTRLLARGAGRHRALARPRPARGRRGLRRAAAAPRPRCRCSASASATRPSGQAFGGMVDRAPRLMHGKTSPVRHDGARRLRRPARPFVATRYHSWWSKETAAGRARAASPGPTTARLMGLRHREQPSGRAVPPRVGAHRRRAAPDRQLPRALCRARGRRRRSCAPADRRPRSTRASALPRGLDESLGRAARPKRCSASSWTAPSATPIRRRCWWRCG